ncbi:MAG: DUF3137 domain-containing protein [Alphaproteobacteria bacterium]
MSVRGQREFIRKKRQQQEDLARMNEVDRVDEDRFTKELTGLIKESEDLRLGYMRKHRMRGWVAINLSILIILIGVAAFGWLFMMEGRLFEAVAFLFLSFIPCIVLQIWAARPIEQYKEAHKAVFMPKLAKALNGLSYYPSRGISSKKIERLAVVPAHERYEAEDCFMGRYKDAKVIFSEARLYSRAKKDGPVFDGIFVMLEAPEDVFEGHTIITANKEMEKAYANTRWKTLSPVDIQVSDPDWDRFSIYSTEPEKIRGVVDERLLKELAEVGDVFNNAPLTAVLFKKRFIFMMIPHDQDMFEASDLFVPVTTRDQALRVKKEIEQLLEVVDVFDLYQKQ